MSRFGALTRDPLRVNALLIVVAFGSMFLLPSQTTSSVITYLLVLFMLARFGRWRSYLKDPVLQLSGVLLAYLSLSALWSEPLRTDKLGSILSRALSTFLFLVAFAEAWQTGFVQRWFRPTLSVCGAIAAYAAIVYFYATSPEDGRLNGLGQLGAHVIAGLMFGVVLIHLLDSLRGGQRSRVWVGIAVLAAVGLIAAILLTGSRNAWVSVLAGLTVYATASVSRSPARFLVAAVLLVAAAATALGLAYLDDAGQEFLFPRGDSFRPLIWSTILERVWTQAPVVGLGIHTPDDVVNGPFLHPHPHSMYLAVLYQGGIVALTGFLALIALVVARLVAAVPRREAAVGLGVLGIALPCYLLDGHELVDRIGETWLFFWLPVAMAAALSAPQPPRAL